MSLSLSLCLAVLALSAQKVSARNCVGSNATVYVDLADYNVNGNTRLQQYGASVGVGTPLQNNSLWPSITHNETVLVQPDYCGAFSPKSCGANYHGFIAIAYSSTWQNQSRTYGSTDNLTAYANVSGLFGKDTFNLYALSRNASSSTNLYGYPMAALSNYSSTLNPFFGPGGTIGLGAASTLIDRLYSDQLIAGYSYGLYLGNKYAREGGTQNGSLVLGGYDAQRFTGPVHTYPLTASTGTLATSYSPFKITVTQMSLNPKNGKSTNLITDSSFDAYLTTSQYPMSLPSSVNQKLTSTLSLSPANNDDNTLKAPSAFQGTMTITLSNNLTFTFDASWLTNTTSNTTPFSDSPGAPAIFGAAFLSQAYLFVQYDATPPSFSLAQVLPYAAKPELRPLCSGLTPSPASTTTSPSSSSSSSSTSNPTTPPSHSHTGAIAGSIVAAVFLVLALLALYLYCFRGLISRLTGRPNPNRDSVTSASSPRVAAGFMRKARGFGSDSKDRLEEHMYSRGGWERTTSKEDVARVSTKEVGGGGGGGRDIEMSPLSDRGRF